jgi:hypothetical protein
MNYRLPSEVKPARKRLPWTTSGISFGEIIILE